MVVMLRVVSAFPWLLLLVSAAGAAAGVSGVLLAVLFGGLVSLLLLRFVRRHAVRAMPAARPAPEPPAKDEIYVQNDCCTGCGVPYQLAPELFVNGEHGCSLQRQPATSTELRQALRVLRTQDLGCVRYRGQNPRVLAVLSQIGCRVHCDQAK